MKETHYAVVFLDILMNGLNGLETARQLRKTSPEVLLVFVTTEADYAIEGYEVEAAGFLIKETAYQKSRLIRLMNRLQQRLQQDEILDFSDHNVSIQLVIKEILYIEVLDHQMVFHIKKGDTYSLRMTMEEIKARLPQDGRFFECHRGILINLDAVSALKGQVVLMENSDTLPVSRRRRSELEKAYAARNIARVRRTL